MAGKRRLRLRRRSTYPFVPIRRGITKFRVNNALTPLLTGHIGIWEGVRFVEDGVDWNRNKSAIDDAVRMFTFSPALTTELLKPISLEEMMKWDKEDEE